MKQQQLAARQSHDTELQAQIDGLALKLSAYQATLTETESRETSAKSNLIRLGKKTAGEVVRL
jgi:hypothetical protein